MLLNVAFSELKMKKGKVVLTNRGSILSNKPKETNQKEKGSVATLKSTRILILGSGIQSSLFIAAWQPD